MNPTLYIIAPSYNEAEGIEPFIERVGEIAATELSGRNIRTRLLIVDDGSGDATFQRIVSRPQASHPALAVTAIRLSRNFGQQAAFQAGLEHSFSEAGPDALFILMDSDLQHPPELIPRITDALQSGFDHVQMVRSEPESLPLSKRLSSRMFYWLMLNLSELELPPGSSDFRGMSHRFVQAYLRLKETGRFNRGLFFWLGFPRCDIPYQAVQRRFGSTKYGFGRMLRLAGVALTQFSSKPLILFSSLTAILSFGFCFAYFLYLGIAFLRGTPFVLGWASLVFIVSFWSGALALGQLMLSLYVSRLFDEIKSRPIYVVQEISSVPNGAAAGSSQPAAAATPTTDVE